MSLSVSQANNNNKYLTSFDTERVNETGSGNNSKSIMGGSITDKNDNTNPVHNDTAKNIGETSLDKALSDVLGADYPKIKAELKRICEELGLPAPEKKVELSNTKIEEIVDKVKKIVKFLNDNNLEINAENLFKGICYTRDTNILERNGITRGEYKELVKNGEAKSLRELLGLGENEEITEAKVAEYAKNLVNKMVEDAKNSPNPEQALKEAIAEQKKQFAICLVSTPIKDRAVLVGALHHAFSENRVDFLNDILSSLNYEDRVTLVKQMDWEKISAILSKPDAKGDVCGLDEKTAMVVSLSKLQGAETIKANEEQFMKEARAFFAKPEVAAVQAKIKNREELTAEESKIAKEIETYTAYSAGTQIGVANSLELSDESINELIKLIQHDSYELPNYRDVVKAMVTFVENEENAEYLSISKEQFAELMDKVSNGNYSTVAGDMEYERQTGEVRESALNAPKDPNATSNADLGFKTEGAGNTANLNDLTAQIAEQSKVNDQEFEIVKNEAKSTKEDKPKSPIKRMAYCIKNIGKKVGKFAKELASTVSKVSNTIVTMCLQRTSGEAFDIIRKNADDSAILATKGKGLTTYQSGLLFEDIKEINEKREETEVA